MDARLAKEFFALRDTLVDVVDYYINDTEESEQLVEKLMVQFSINPVKE